MFSALPGCHAGQLGAWAGTTVGEITVFIFRYAPHDLE